jgi:hypothetical protein
MDESAIQRCVDLELIRELIAEYADCLAVGDLRGLRDLWVPHGSMDMGGGAVHRGAVELRELFLDRVRLYEEMSMQHTNVRLVSYDGTSASVTSALHAIHVARDQDLQVVTWGRYEDDVVLEGGRWKFLSRRLLVQALRHTPKDDVPARFTRLPHLADPGSSDAW